MAKIWPQHVWSNCVSNTYLKHHEPLFFWLCVHYHQTPKQFLFWFSYIWNWDHGLFLENIHFKVKLFLYIKICAVPRACIWAETAEVTLTNIGWQIWVSSTYISFLCHVFFVDYSFKQAIPGRTRNLLYVAKICQLKQLLAQFLLCF